MQALRDFWAKSATNKLILVAAVGLLCCCPIGLAGRGGQTAQVLPTPPSATTIAPPTEPPALTMTPVPTAAPDPSPVAGLGVNRDALQRAFSGLGFRFEESALQDGTPRLLGQGPSSVMVELIGPAENLVSVGLIAPLPSGDAEAESAVGTYLGMLVNAVAPEHLQAITEWVVEQLRATRRGDDVTGVTLDTGTFQSEMTTIVANDGILLTYSLSTR